MVANGIAQTEPFRARKLPNKILTHAALALAVLGLSACAQDEPSVAEVTQRFDTMVQFVGDARGTTTIAAESSGKLWAMVRRDDVGTVSPSDCTFDQAVMDSPSEELNVPEPDDLGAPGKPQTMFAFASSSVEGEGTYAVRCSADADALLFLFEPEG